MTYVFDLDGTLLETDGGDYTQAKPIKKRVEKLLSLVIEGHTIVIQTGRNKSYYDFTVDQLKKFNIPYHGLSVGDKVHGCIYVDDKGVNANDFFNENKTA